MEPEGSLQCLQHFVIRLYPDPFIFRSSDKLIFDKWLQCFLRTKGEVEVCPYVPYPQMLKTF